MYRGRWYCRPLKCGRSNHWLYLRPVRIPTYCGYNCRHPCPGRFACALPQENSTVLLPPHTAEYSSVATWPNPGAALPSAPYVSTLPPPRFRPVTTIKLPPDPDATVL